jgi:hypothetical protein
VRPTRRSSATSADSRALGDGGAHTHAVSRHLSRLGQRRQELGRLRARERAAATPEIAKVSRRSIRGTEYFHGVSWRFVNFFYEFKCWFHVLVFAVSGIYTKYYPPSPPPPPAATTALTSSSFIPAAARAAANRGARDGPRRPRARPLATARASSGGQRHQPQLRGGSQHLVSAAKATRPCNLLLPPPRTSLWVYNNCPRLTPCG